MFSSVNFDVVLICLGIGDVMEFLLLVCCEVMKIVIDVMGIVEGFYGYGLE